LAICFFSSSAILPLVLSWVFPSVSSFSASSSSSSAALVSLLLFSSSSTTSFSLSSSWASSSFSFSSSVALLLFSPFSAFKFPLSTSNSFKLLALELFFFSSSEILLLVSSWVFPSVSSSSSLLVGLLLFSSSSATSSSLSSWAPSSFSFSSSVIMPLFFPFSVSQSGFFFSELISLFSFPSMGLFFFSSSCEDSFFIFVSTSGQAIFVLLLSLPITASFAAVVSSSSSSEVVFEMTLLITPFPVSSSLLSPHDDFMMSTLVPLVSWKSSFFFSMFVSKIGELVVAWSFSISSFVERGFEFVALSRVLHSEFTFSNLSRSAAALILPSLLFLSSKVRSSCEIWSCSYVFWFSSYVSFNFSYFDCKSPAFWDISSFSAFSLSTSAAISVTSFWFLSFCVENLSRYVRSISFKSYSFAFNWPW